MSSLRPQPVLAPGTHRKKPLTEAEKAQIWRFHKENPLVTHLDIATFFGIERSTVSKIVHQSYFQEFSVAKDYATFTPRDSFRQQTQRLDTQCALSDWFQDSHSAGIPITRAMIRKQAAILAATAWKLNNSSDFDDNVIEGESRWREDVKSSRSPSSSVDSLPSAYMTTPVESNPPSNFPYTGTWNQQPSVSDSWDTSSSLGSAQIPGWTGLESPNHTDHMQTGIPPGSPTSTAATDTLGFDICATQSVPACSDALHAIDTLHSHLTRSAELTALDLFCLRHLQDRLKNPRLNG